MRANILFCLYFFMGLAVQLQAQVTVTGKVIDEQQHSAAQSQALLQRNTELIECLLQLRINLLVLRLLCQRIGIEFRPAG